MSHAWWRDCDYELFNRLTKERDAAHAAHARGVAEERARVVADLRERAAELFDDLPDNVAGELTDRADRIERGEHEEGQ